jgi:hypothetical protein
MYGFDAGAGEQAITSTIRGLQWLEASGIETVYFGVSDIYSLEPLEMIAERVMPEFSRATSAV